MKKGNIYVGKVSHIAFPNKGIVFAEGEKVVVKNTIPGQTVSFILTKNKTGLKEGRLLSVEERSPAESCDKTCEVFEKCGGCIYQTIPYEEEIRIKEGQIRRLFENYFSVTPEYRDVDTDDIFLPIKPSPESRGYRNKMEYSFGDEVKGGELTLGMHVSGHFNDIVNTGGCNIAHEDFERIRKATRDFFAGTGIPFYHKNSGEGVLRHLLLRRGTATGEILIGIVTASFDETEMGEVLGSYVNCVKELDLSGEVVGIINIINDNSGDAVKADEVRLLYGRDHFYDEVLGLKFKITPFSFFQTNTKGAEVLYSTVREFVREALEEESGGSFDKGMDSAGDAFTGGVRTGTVFDLYSGTGTITQLLSGCAEKVTGIELVEEAVAAARENAGSNGIKNVDFISGDVLKCLEKLDVRPDIIIMDPPREGAVKKALDKILSYEVNHIIYVSCKPTSLIRDLETFTERGYRIKKAVPIDMFPRTGNCESIALLERVSNRKADAKVHIDVDLEDYYRIKDAQGKDGK